MKKHGENKWLSENKNCNLRNKLNQTVMKKHGENKWLSENKNCNLRNKLNQHKSDIPI